MEQLLVTQARVGDQDSFEYSTAYVIDRPNSVADQLKALGVPVTLLGNGSGFSWIADLRRHLVDHEIDIVHAHSPVSAAAARVIARTVRKSRPVTVYTEHNMWSSHKLPTRTVNAVTYPLDSKQLAVSNGVLESIPKPLRGKISVLTHGIDTDNVRGRSTGGSVRAELGISPESLLCVTVANLRRQKAYDVWLEAAARLIADGVDATFLSVGQGPLEAELKSQRESLGLTDRFHFLGHRSDIPELLGAADLFVLPSRHEGLPLALMEAMSIGLPMVVTSVGGIPEYVTTEKNGVMIEPESADQIVAAVSRLAGDPELRAALGAAALESSEVFDAIHAVRHIEDMYRSVIGRGDR